MPGAKFESSSFSTFGDMTLQNFPLKKGMSHQIQIPLGKGFNFKNLSFDVQNRSFDP